MKNIIEIITTGDEILSGITQDTNFSWLCDSIFKYGLKVNYHQCIGDNLEHLINSLELASSRSNIIIFTGGLGPTDDDLTRLAASRFFNKKLIQNKNSEEKIKNIFKKRKRKYSKINRKQSFFPEGSKIIENPFGTADGFLIKKKNSSFYFFPGVPKELKIMIEKSLFKNLYKLIKSSQNFMKSEMLKIYGLPESEVAEIIDGINSTNTEVGYRPSNFEIHLRLTSFGNTSENALSESKRFKRRIEKRLKNFIFSDKGETLAEVVFRKLLSNKITISFAESCTGGMISNTLTDIPGSSKVYGLGLNTYSNTAKNKILNVPYKLINKHGAVSRVVVRSMVKNLIKLSGSDVGVAISGIAGPDGGTDDKPIGTVFVAYLMNNKVITKKYFFTGTRKTVKLRTTLEVFDFLRKNL
tara:strand:- start:57566 stop:58801 length:1236 start_codon:yes stop_codon:yes gene_type:complete